jgi:hypothetical protein
MMSCVREKKQALVKKRREGKLDEGAALCLEESFASLMVATWEATAPLH